MKTNIDLKFTEYQKRCLVISYVKKRYPVPPEFIFELVELAQEEEKRREKFYKALDKKK